MFFSRDVDYSQMRDEIIGHIKFILCVDAFDVADSLLFDFFEVNYIILELIKGRHKFNNFHTC